MKDILVNDKFRVDYKIGQGGFGLVYAGTFLFCYSLRVGADARKLGTDIETKEEVAIKLTHVRDGPDALEYEADTYAALSGGTGIPRFMWFGQECDFYVLVHELLGPSLEDLFAYCGRKFSLKTVLLIADQALRRIKYIHDNGYLHCDIKPDNFLLGLGGNGNVLYTIDFGLARDFDATKGLGTLDHRPLGGTTRYASLNNHMGHEQSRADDLESLGYVLLYFARGSLPWQGLKAPTSKELVERIRQKKTDTTVETLCKDLPEEFATYMTYTRSLQPTDKPNYAYLLRLFSRLLAARGFKYDNIFDWTEKRFHELRGNATWTEETPGTPAN